MSSHPFVALSPSAPSAQPAPAGAASTRSAGMCPRGCEAASGVTPQSHLEYRISGGRVCGVMGQSFGFEVSGYRFRIQVPPRDTAISAENILLPLQST
jgi:hypothetical protein